MSRSSETALPAKPRRVRTLASTVLATAIATALAGCATPTTSDDIDAGAGRPSDSIHYTVRSGDVLGNIALGFTGDADTWRTIAEHNGIQNPKKLAVGTTIEIPGTLLVGSELQRLAKATASTPTDRSVPASIPAARVANQEPVRVIVTPVTTNKRFELSSMTSDAATTTLGTRQVKVVGTYFPKGIYTRPEDGSRVFMRLAPGTVLGLEREYDGWFRVTTSEGVGFLRSNDGEVLSRPVENVPG